ncbi:transcription regulator hth lysr [Lucifera butyrica]|uniref:Transcription regulator hth lysr n=1 Tax=Lucifera butyrica TaxID=1351585 RepID=A0A498RDN1_9FIRM|nr:LysR family transcriptional regulator [Lucifera butyrica]VBB09085.1 transcription regulator hth lysr [Lucifera butyrica]
MDIQLFRTFLLVANLGNITQVAEQLNFTQPAITSQIKTLEDHLGVSLFERVGKKLYITDAGRELAIRAEKLLAAYEDIHESMQSFAGQNKPIRLGASTTAASYILSPILRDFQSRNLNDPVIVDICPTLPVTVKGLLENTFDLAITHDKIENNQLVQFDFSREKLVWVVSRRLLAQNRNSRDISRYPFINFRPGCVYRNKCERAITAKNIHSFIEYSDAEAIKRAVLDGLGISILPYVLVEPFLADGTLVEFIDAPHQTFTLSITLHKGKIISPAMRALLTLFAEHTDIATGLIEYLQTNA